MIRELRVCLTLIFTDSCEPCCSFSEGYPKRSVTNEPQSMPSITLNPDIMACCLLLGKNLRRQNAEAVGRWEFVKHCFFEDFANRILACWTPFLGKLPTGHRSKGGRTQQQQQQLLMLLTFLLQASSIQKDKSQLPLLAETFSLNVADASTTPKTLEAPNMDPNVYQDSTWKAFCLILCDCSARFGILAFGLDDCFDVAAELEARKVNRQNIASHDKHGLPL